MAKRFLSQVFNFICFDNATEMEAAMQLFETQTIGGLKFLMLSPQDLVLLCSVNRNLLLEKFDTTGFIGEPDNYKPLVVHLKQLKYWGMKFLDDYIEVGVHSDGIFEKLTNRNNQYSSFLQNVINFQGYQDHLTLKELVESVQLTMKQFVSLLRITSLYLATVVRKSVPISTFSVLIFIPLLKFFEKYPSHPFVLRMETNSMESIEQDNILFYQRKPKINISTFPEAQKILRTIRSSKGPCGPPVFRGASLATLIMFLKPQKEYTAVELTTLCGHYFPHVAENYEDWETKFARSLHQCSLFEKREQRTFLAGKVVMMYLGAEDIQKYRKQLISFPLDSFHDKKYKTKMQNMKDNAFKQIRHLELGMFICKNGLWSTVPPYYLLEANVPTIPSFVLVHTGPAPIGYENDPNWVVTDQFSVVPKEENDDEVAVDSDNVQSTK